MNEGSRASLRRTEESGKHVFVLFPSITLKHPELHGILITLNLILPVSESYKRN